MLCLKWFRGVISHPLPILNTRFKFKEKNHTRANLLNLFKLVLWKRCLILWTWIMMIILFQKIPNLRGWQNSVALFIKKKKYWRQNMCQTLQCMLEISRLAQSPQLLLPSGSMACSSIKAPSTSPRAYLQACVPEHMCLNKFWSPEQIAPFRSKHWHFFFFFSEWHIYYNWWSTDI